LVILMKYLLLVLLLLFSHSVLTPEPRYEVGVGKGIGEDVKAPVEQPMKPQKVPYDSTWTEHDCLSHNIYFEARSEGELGMILVAQVTLNRVASDKPYMKNTICGVIKTRNAFQWYWDGKSDIPKHKKAFKQAQAIATRAINGEFTGVTKSLYFKVCETQSRFFDKLVLYKRHKRHCYYLEK